MIRALEPEDLPALRTLAAADPDLDLSPESIAALVAPGKLAVGDLPHAAVVMAPVDRARMRHVGRLTVLGAGRADPLLSQVREIADRWWHLDRLELELPMDAAWKPTGFALEVVRKEDLARGKARTSTGLWAWTRPGLVSANAPQQHARPMPAPPGSFVIRSSTPDDAAGFAQVMGTPGARWGTLQVPHTSVASWRARLEKNDPARTKMFVAVAGGEVIATAGLHGALGPRRAHVWTLGMSVADPWQGRGVGKQLFETLMRTAEEVRAERVELDVYTDNLRAISLYAKFGFQPEGTKRLEAWRDGAYTDALVMSRLRGG